jgi:4-hydroxybenzoate polyprenyltransferase
MPPNLLTCLQGFRFIRGPLCRATLLLSSALLFLNITGIKNDDIITPLILFFLNMIAYLWVGWAVNDLSDRETDAAAGKFRTFGAVQPKFAILGIILLSSVTLLSGWFFFHNPGYMALLIIGLVLSLLYSLPPFRLKGRGLSGLICIGFSGKIIPILLTVILFFTFEYWILLLMLAEGIKIGIDTLFHQIEDYETDLDSKIITYPVQAGLSHAVDLLKNLSILKVFLAFLLGIVYSLFVPQYGIILGLLIAGYYPARYSINKIILRLARHEIDYQSFFYTWFSEMVFALSPFWLSIILSTRYSTGVIITGMIGCICIIMVLNFFKIRIQPSRSKVSDYWLSLKSR